MVTPDGMAIELRCGHACVMPRTRTRASHAPQVTGPHPWAFLALWRESVGLTQENVSETFGVTNVTIHRWETGKSPVSVENFFRLARLYGATPGQLMFAPEDRERAQALQSAWQIIGAMRPEDRDSWLSIGRSLAGQRAADDGGQER